MLDRPYSTNATPDHLVPETDEERGAPKPTGMRKSAPTLEQAELEEYYSQIDKTPDHLDGTLDSAAKSIVRQSSVGSDLERNAGDILTDKAQVGILAGDVNENPVVDNPLFEDYFDEEETPKPADSESAEQYRVRNPSGDGYLNISNLQPPQLNDRDKDLEWVESNPELAKIAVESGVTPEELVQVVNFDNSDKAAEAIISQLEALGGMSPGSAAYRQTLDLINGTIRQLNQNQRIVINAMIQAKLDENRANYMDAAYGEPGRTYSNVYDKPGEEQVDKAAGALGGAVSRFWNNGITNIGPNTLPFVDGFPGVTVGSAISAGLDALTTDAVEQNILDSGMLPTDGEGNLRLSLSGALNMAFGIVDNTQQAVRMGIAAGSLPGIINGSSQDVAEAFREGGIQEAWNLFSDGAISPSTYRDLVEKYGQLPVDRMLQLQKWQEEGKSPLVMAITEWGEDDPWAADLAFVLTGMGDESKSQTDIVALVNDLKNATNDSFFNIMVGNEYRGSAVQSLKGPTDFAFQMVVDPFWVGAKPLKAMRYARYSMKNLENAQTAELETLIKQIDATDSAKTASNLQDVGLVTFDTQTGNALAVSPAVAEMFGRKKVRRAFDAIGGQLRKIDAIDDLQERGDRRAALISTWKKYIPEEMLKEMSEQKVYSANDAARWYHDNSLVASVLSGVAVREAPSAGLIDLASEQAAALRGAAIAMGDINTARRATVWSDSPFVGVQLGQKATHKPLMPNISLFGEQAKLAAGLGKYATIRYVTAPHRRALEKLYMTKDNLNQTPAEQVAAVNIILNGNPELVAAIDSDWLTVVRNAEKPEDLGKLVTPENIDDVVLSMQAYAKANGTTLPMLAATNTGIGEIFNAVRKWERLSEVRGTTRKNGGERTWTRGRELRVDGKNVLTGKKINNTYGRKRKDSLVARWKDIGSEDFWAANAFGGGLLRRRLDRWSRAAARYPHNTQLDLNSNNGRQVYEFARAWGLSTAHANLLREVWKESTVAQRLSLGNALAESAAYSRGVPYIFRDPKDAETYIKSLRAGDVDQSMYSTTVRKTGATSTVPAAGVVDENNKTAQSTAEQTWNPARYDGPNGPTTSALHNWQTTETVSLPNIAAIERISARKSVMNLLLQNNSFGDNLVNWWSLLTLAGPRYQIRAGLEDFVFYGFTQPSGWLRRWFRGEEYDEAVRLAMGEKPNTIKKVIGPKASDGRVTRAAYEMSALRGLYKYLRPVEKAEVEEAMKNLNMGNREKMVKLVAKARNRQAMSQIRQRVGGKKARAREAEYQRYLDELVGDEATFANMKEVSEGGQFISNGQMPMTSSERRVPGLRYGAVTKRGEVVLADFLRGRDINDLAVSKAVFEVWGRQIFGIISGDGALAQTALRNLKTWANADPTDQARIVQEMVEALESMPAGWAEKLTILNSVSPADYARRYMDDTLGVFSRRDGSVNDELLGILRTRKGNYSARKATYENLSQIGRVGNDYDATQLPRAIYDRYGTIEMPVGMQGITADQRIYGAMGNSLNRLTREPIFMSNYILAREELASWERNQVQVLKSLGLSNERAAKVAGQRAASISSDRAMNLTLSFTDNPNTRSMLAWQVRNVSRYWRAQEDLFRRLGRAVRYKPMAIWRGALAYNVMQDSGLLWENEQGEKYFIYMFPEPVLNTLTWTSEKLGASVYRGPLPVTFTGKLTSLTPSADPNALFPTLTGGGPTIMWSAGELIENFAPSLGRVMDQIEPYVYGPYGAPENIADSIPFNIMRVFELGIVGTNFVGSRDELRSGFIADSVVTAMRGLAAADLVPEDVQLSEVKQEEFKKQVENTSMWVAAMRMLFGFVEPARASMQTATPTDIARELGISSFRPQFLELVNELDGDVELATTKWIGMFPELAPFVVGRTEAAGEDIPFGSISASEAGAQFLKDNENLLAEYPTALPYLGPEDDSSLQGFVDVADLGLRRDKKVSEVNEELIYSESAAKVQLAKRKERRALQDLDGAFAEGLLSEEQYDQAKASVRAETDAVVEPLIGESSTFSDFRSRFELPGREYAKEAVEQMRGAVADLRAKEAKVDAGINDSFNKLDVAEVALGAYDGTVSALNDLAAQADQLGVTETRRREKAIIEEFTNLIESNFGFPQGAETGSLMNFGFAYMLPAVEDVYTEG